MKLIYVVEIIIGHKCYEEFLNLHQKYSVESVVTFVFPLTKTQTEHAFYHATMTRWFTTTIRTVTEKIFVNKCILWSPDILLLPIDVPSDVEREISLCVSNILGEDFDDCPLTSGLFKGSDNRSGK